MQVEIGSCMDAVMMDDEIVPFSMHFMTHNIVDITNLGPFSIYG